MSKKQNLTPTTAAAKPTKAKAQPTTPLAAQKARDTEKLAAVLKPAKAPAKAKVKAKPERTDKTAAPVDAALSKAVAKSWGDAKVRKARTTRSGCKVGNKEYPSVKAAFIDQGWPLGIHQRIRLIVKAEGVAEVEGKKIVLVKE